MKRKIPALALWLFAAVILVRAVAPTQAAEPPKLAIEGYDPVAYFTEKQPIEGKADFTYDWDDLRYRFSSAANRDRFVANPDRYAPNYAGNCAAFLATKGERLPANPKYWLIVDGKLYLFAAARWPEIFSKDPSLLERANAGWKTAPRPKN